MKKKDKGFILVETLIVSTFIISTLVYLYIQFVNLKKSYDISFRYDTISGLYNSKNIEKFINSNYGFSTFIDSVNNSSEDYVELYNNECNYLYFSDNVSYCEQLMKSIDAKTVLLTKNNLTNIKSNFKVSNPYSNQLYLYIKNINYAENNNTYLLIVEYKDNTFSNIKIELSEEE